MRAKFLILFATILFTSGARAAPPNIVLIIADDLGYGDLGCYGCKDIPTPNIDSIARAGVRFTDAHAYNVCSPTRAALRTGRYAERNGIRTVLMGGNPQNFAGAVTLAEMLHGSGYATALVGKWHLGYAGGAIPTRLGYDLFFGHLGGKIDYFKHTDSTQKNGTPGGKHDLWENDKEVFVAGYSTELFTDRAVRFIRDHADKPFYLEVAYNAPHYSTKKGVYQAPQSYLDKFHVAGDPDNTRGAYAAMVSCMDDGVGRILGELKARGVDRNTLVVFLSDNGAEARGSNGDLAGGKHNNKEGGIRVPWVAAMPGKIPAGTVRTDVVHVIDLTPTCLALAQAKPKEGTKFDGFDVWPAFSGSGTVPERPLCFPRDTIRRGKWKLSGGKLIDLEADPGETKDLAEAFPEICSRLAGELAAWQQEMKIKPAGDRGKGK